MKKGVLIGIFLLGLVGLILGILINQKPKNIEPDNSECVFDSDCAYAYTNQEEACEACDLSDENWVCLDKATASQEREKRLQLHKGVMCERCLETETNADKFKCGCVAGLCVKDKQ